MIPSPLVGEGQGGGEQALKTEALIQDAGCPNPRRLAIPWRAAAPSSPINNFASAWAFSQEGSIRARIFMPWDVSRIFWFRPPSGGSDGQTDSDGSSE